MAAVVVAVTSGLVSHVWNRQEVVRTSPGGCRLKIDLYDEGGRSPPCGGALSDLDHDSAAGSGFDGGVGVGYLIEGVSGSDVGAEAGVEQGFGEGAGCVGFDSGREVVASEQAQ